MRAVQHQAHIAWYAAWKDEAWPNVVFRILKNTMSWCKGQSSSDENVEECVYCQRPWTEVESRSHGVFDCESLEQVPRLSYSKFGPGSYASIDCNANHWFGIVSQMSSNPYSEKVNGKGHIVRLACLATILGVYEGRGHSIEDDDNSRRCADWSLNWKEC